MPLIDLLSLFQQIAAMLQTVFQSSTNVILALGGLLAALVTAIGIAKQLAKLLKRDSPKRRSSQSKYPTSSTNRPRDGKPTQWRTKQASSTDPITTDSDVVRKVSPEPRTSTVRNSTEEPQRSRLVTSQSATISPTERPHPEPALLPPVSGIKHQNDNLRVDDGGSVPQPLESPKEKRTVRHVEFVHSYPWQSDNLDRKAAGNALTAATNLVRLAYEIQDASHQQTRSLKLFAKHLRFISSLADSLARLHRQATNLDNALESLDLVWEGDDPRLTFLSYLDPFATRQSPRSPEDMRLVFQREAERIAVAIENNIGSIVQRTPEWSNNGRWVSYKLAPPSTE